MGLPTLPAGWSYAPLKRVTTVRFSSVDKHSLPEETPVRLCNYLDVYRSEQITRRLEFMQATASRSEIERFSLLPGDVLLTKDSEEPSDIGVPSCVVEQLDGVVCGYHLALVRPRPDVVDGRFLQRSLQATGIRDQFYARAVGVTRFAIGLGEVGDALVPVAPLMVQHRIAAFLDHKTAAIDQLIQRKERLIELLREKREALITQAVTKGLDPNVPKKDSGVGWIGSFPAHWQLRRLKQIATRLVVGIAQAATQAYAASGIPLVRSTNLRRDRLLVDDLLYIDKSFADQLRSKYIRPGDLLTVRTGNAGVTAVVPPELPISQCFTMLITTLRQEHSPYFFSLQLNSAIGATHFRRESWGTAQENISVPILQNTPVLVPPPSEQRGIVTMLNERTANVDAALAAVERQTQVLREYRQALISAAVTGQFAVAGDAA
jgi:type I restriction enzyme S subunit